MIPDLDVYRAAHLLLERHGADAEIVAAQRVDEMTERQDYEGRYIWMMVKRAIVELQAPPTGPLH